jgi:hypothetical protein
MKTTLSILFVLLLTAAVSTTAFAQLKSQSHADESASSAMVRQSSGSWGGGLSSFFGLLSPDRFTMRHTFGLNYMSSGGTGLSMASYTNSMFYRIADPLDVRVDVTLQGSPFGPTAGMDRNELSGIYLSRAELNYRPWDNVFLQFQYREMPYSAYYNRNPFDPFYYGGPWGDR